MEKEGILENSLKNEIWGNSHIRNNGISNEEGTYKNDVNAYYELGYADDKHISNEDIRKKLYDTFLKPTKKDSKEYIGIEIEIPIVNFNKEAVDFSIVHQVTESFLNEFDTFQIEGRDYEGNIYALKDELTGDMLCYDCSYNNIEFAMGKEEDLFTINKRFKKYYGFVKGEFEKYNHTLTGMGINPYRKYNNEIPIPNERYLMLFNHLKSFPKYSDKMMYFHNYPAYGMFSSASQVQLDVPYEELLDTINIFSKLEPIKALLFSNSVLLEENEDYLCFRDILWEHSTHGVNPHNIGMYDIEFEGMEELLSYLESLDIYCVERNGIYINFPSMNLKDYFNSEKIIGEYYCKGEYKTTEFKPSIDDINYLRAFKFINLTFRGTLEYRSVCTQPIGNSMSVAAFHVGLKHKLNELKSLFFNSPVYHNSYNSNELRKFLIKREIPDSINKKDLEELTRNVLDLAYDGLKERNLGEEIFLVSLYENLENKTNPGKHLLDSLENGKSLEELIKEYGDL